jgi:competence protein ComEC
MARDTMKNMDKVRLYKVVLSTVCVIMLAAAYICGPLEKHSVSADEHNDFIEYVMCDVSRVHQGDAHIIKFTNNTVYAIDVGYDSQVVSCLKKNTVNAIDKVFISHAHKDHYQGIYDVIKGGIKINTVYFNNPDREVCDSEKPWGCDYDHVQKTIAFIKNKGITVKNVKAGDTFHPQKDVVLSVIAASDGKITPAGRTDVNDASMIMRLVFTDISVFFTGDLNKPLSDYLSNHSNELRSAVLKVPHHGTEGCASNAFFDAVSPKVALVPSPKDLWLSDRSKRIRDYFSGKNIPVLVSGIDGDVTVILYQDRYEVAKNRFL